MNPFHDFLLSFQFISHKILRWIFVPIALPFLYFLNSFLAYRSGMMEINVYSLLFWLQTTFYLLALMGWLTQKKNTMLKFLFVPYYILVMNIAMWLGFFRFIKGKQSVNWERAKRAS